MGEGHGAGPCQLLPGGEAGRKLLAEGDFRAGSSAVNCALAASGAGHCKVERSQNTEDGFQKIREAGKETWSAGVEQLSQR